MQWPLIFGGYGDTEAPESVTSYTCFHLVGDIIALIDSLGVDKVYLVGHDWRAIIGWYVCMFRPERVKAYVCLSVPFRTFLGRDPKINNYDAFHAKYGDDYYVCRFQVKINSRLSTMYNKILGYNSIHLMLTLIGTWKRGSRIG